ncbi:MAG: DUF5683 domain-containing protein [Cytophagales bacterium]|nr:DUF5683 domain-containing protein [Bernardetiaceae bacterium]MDW8210092.1 DUF5683 domain-containing protein [Cytophagales bacterium]
MRHLQAIKWIAIGLLLLTCTQVWGQITPPARQNQEEVVYDTVALKRRLDSLTQLIEGPKPISEPTKAALLSAVLPGLGQIYNGKFWYLKVPAIYAAAGALLLTLRFNQQNYVGFRDAYQYRLDKNPFTTPEPRFSSGTDEGLRSQRDRFRRERDYTIILGIGLYLLQIAEAAATAHMKTFDVSDDLALRFKPKLQLLPTAPFSTVGVELLISWNNSRHWR